MTSAQQSNKPRRATRQPRTRWWPALVVLALVAVMLSEPGAAQAQPATANDSVASEGTCGDMGLSVVEPTSVAWQSDTSPVLNPRYLWAYGDVDSLWDNTLDDYWFHWYAAVPGDDPFVVYEFEPNTMIAGVEFITDWSSGDLQFQGLNEQGEPVSALMSVPLEDPFKPYAAPLEPMTIDRVKLTTSTPQVKLLEVDFCGSTDVSNDDPDDPDPTCEDLGTCPVGDCASADPADGHCESVQVIDSFGDAWLPAGADTTMPWVSVSAYYDAYGDRQDMCSIDVHNSYWTAVRNPDGGLDYYPSWHPPVHDPGGPQECYFTHEHGIDPRTSDLYDEDLPTNVGVPFGFVHPGAGDTSGRVEDHVGHKVVVWNDFHLTTSNPYHGPGFALSLFEPAGEPITCDWYSKLHQGTHGPDALGFNLHEYFLNYSCDDGTEVRIKEMTDFGFRLPSSAASPDFALTGGSGTVGGCGWFSTNVPGPAADPDPSSSSDFGDAGRGFNCLMNDAKIEELWKPSASVSAPDGAGSIDYDPYYVVMNPNRFALFEWWEFLEQDGDHVGETAMISMVDFCVDGTELRNELMRPEAPDNFVQAGDSFSGPFRIQTFCASIDTQVLEQWEQDIEAAGGDTTTLMTARKESVDNAFVGTRRGVHTKGPVVYGRDANLGLLAYFCTDHLGNAASWPTNPDTGASVTAGAAWSSGDPTPVCSSGVPQIISSTFNQHWAVEGSTAGSTDTGSGFISNGVASEITIDIDALYPDHRVRAPN